MRILLALLLIGCGSSTAARGPELAATPDPTSPALPRAGACDLFVEPGVSNPSPGVECMPPHPLGVLQSAQRREMEGDYLGAANCYVAGYEQYPTEAAYALAAARAYHLADRADLARAYYERVLAGAPSAELATEAREGLAGLEAR